MSRPKLLSINAIVPYVRSSYKMHPADVFAKCSGIKRHMFSIALWSVTKYTDKKDNKIFLIYKKIKRDWVQSHIWLTASSYIVKYLRISSYIRKPFLIYDFAPDPIWIYLYMRTSFFFSIGVHSFLKIYEHAQILILRESYIRKAVGVFCGSYM